MVIGGVGGVVVVVVGGGVLVLVDCFLNGPHPVWFGGVGVLVVCCLGALPIVVWCVLGVGVLVSMYVCVAWG